MTSRKRHQAKRERLARDLAAHCRRLPRLAVLLLTRPDLYFAARARVRPYSIEA